MLEYFPVETFKIFRVTFLKKKNYHLNILGSTSGFRATDDLTHAHCDGTEFTEDLFTEWLAFI